MGRVQEWGVGQLGEEGAVMWPPAPCPPLVLTSLKWPRRLEAGSHSKGRVGHPPH